MPIEKRSKQEMCALPLDLWRAAPLRHRRKSGAAPPTCAAASRRINGAQVGQHIRNHRFCGDGRLTRSKLGGADGGGVGALCGGKGGSGGGGESSP